MRRSFDEFWRQWAAEQGRARASIRVAKVCTLSRPLTTPCARKDSHHGAFCQLAFDLNRHRDCNVSSSRHSALRHGRRLGLLCLRGPSSTSSTRSSSRSYGHLAAAHYYQIWIFSARSQQLYVLELAELPVGYLWARVSPLPALDRPLWAASWYPLCAAFSTACPGQRTATTL